MSDPAAEAAARAYVLRQFRLTPAEDALLVQLQRARGDRHLVETQRYLLSLVPGLIDGQYGIDPRSGD